MFKGDMYYNLNKKEKLIYSIRYISNCLMKLSEDGAGNVIGVTSSLPYKNSKIEICKKICNKIKDTQNKLMFIDIDLNFKDNKKIYEKGNENFREVYLLNWNSQEVLDFIKKEKENYYIIIVNIPPVSIIEEAIEYAKTCGRVVLLERYMYTTYKEYEEILIKLKTQNIKIDGVITYN